MNDKVEHSVQDLLFRNSRPALDEQPRREIFLSSKQMETNSKPKWECPTDKKKPIITELFIRVLINTFSYHSKCFFG